MDAASFVALADPHRLRIVELLKDGPASVGEIAARVELRQPQASKHLRTLADAGYVAVRPIAQRRVYELRPEPFEQLDRWVAAYRPTWDERLDAMARYVRNVPSGSPMSHDHEGTPE